MATELLERILSDENLEEARHKVMSNKGSAGIDRMPVSRLPEFISEHKEEMKELIRQRRYRPLPVKRVQIPKDDGTKRNLGVPAVKDRWIEQAVCQVLTPIFEEEFSESSFGFRPGRKAEQAVVRALEYMNDGYDWIVDLDLTKFFDNVNQDILMILVHLKCKSFLTNLCKIISPVYAIDGNQFEIIEGYPSMISNFRASYSSSESFITFFVL